MPYLVRLKRNWPGNFRRSVRFEPATGEQLLRGGEVRELLEFSPGELCELDETEFRAVAGDIGHAIEHVRLDDSGHPRASEEPVEIAESGEAEGGEQLSALSAPPSAGRRSRRKRQGDDATDN